MTVQTESSLGAWRVHMAAELQSQRAANAALQQQVQQQQASVTPLQASVTTLQAQVAAFLSQGEAASDTVTAAASDRLHDEAADKSPSEALYTQLTTASDTTTDVASGRLHTIAHAALDTDQGCSLLPASHAGMEASDAATDAQAAASPSSDRAMHSQGTPYGNRPLSVQAVFIGNDIPTNASAHSTGRHAAVTRRLTSVDDGCCADAQESQAVNTCFFRTIDAPYRFL